MFDALPIEKFETYKLNESKKQVKKMPRKF